MSSHNELSFDWSTLFQRKSENEWTQSDLQLAAELGKTLLERNKELEILLKEHKNTIEEQEQEIVYLKKHTTALREVNDSRLKVYEQLEVGIQDLERANHRLMVENTSDKKHIKTLTHNIEGLEARCDELARQLEETRQALTVERRKNERLLQEKSHAASEGNVVQLRPVEKANPNASKNAVNGTGSPEQGYDANTTAPENCSFAFLSPDSTRNNQANSTGISSRSGSNVENSFNLSAVGNREDNEDIINLVNDLETTRKAFMTEQQRCGELEEQLVAIIHENQTLQGRIAQNSTNEEMKSVHDELSILDEVRQGQMCCRCLRAVDDRNTINDEHSSIAPTEEDDEEDEERSLLDLDAAAAAAAAAAVGGGETGSELSQAAYRTTMTNIKVSAPVPDSLDLNTPVSPNPYRDLVEKYEALLEVQRSSIVRGKSVSHGLTVGDTFHRDFSETQKLMMEAAAAVSTTASNCNASSNGDGASSCNGSTNQDNPNLNASDKSKNRGRTPTEFSEAETSSSGFSDETSNKSTQTDDRPGYFLCSIGDGEDCKFSIYDDASPIDSRFRNRPEYRELFKEIFAVLKKAAENKEEGDNLPLLDDAHPSAVSGGNSGAKVPPVTPANDEEQPKLIGDYGDDTQSVISSAISEQSFAMSECVTKLERKTAKKHIIEKKNENKPAFMAATGSAAASVSSIIENGRVLTPLKREPLEYLSVGVGIKKKNRKKNRNFSNERSESPVALPSPPRFFVMSGKKRKDLRPFVQSPTTSSGNEQTHSQARPNRRNAKFEWNGNSMVIYNRNMNVSSSHQNGTPRSGELEPHSLEYRPSTVSQDLHKLKKLDLSYAEVLRRADACKHAQQHHQQRRRHQ